MDEADDDVVDKDEDVDIELCVAADDGVATDEAVAALDDEALLVDILEGVEADELVGALEGDDELDEVGVKAEHSQM